MTSTFGLGKRPWGQKSPPPPSEKDPLPAGLAANPHHPSSAAYLAYPVKHVVSSLYRRMTEPPDQPVAKLLDAPNAHPSGLYTPPNRTASPFQPPPLTPLQLQHDHSSDDDDILLSRSLAEEVRLLIPPRLQLVENWRLAYSLEQNGAHLGTLYKHCANISTRSQQAGYVLVIRDGSSAGSLFGAYLSDPPKPSQHYYGTGECFLWRASILPSLSAIQIAAANLSINGNSTKGQRSPPPPSEDLLALAGLPPPPSADTTHAQRTTTVRAEHHHTSPRSSRSSSKPTSPTSPKSPSFARLHKSLSPTSPLQQQADLLALPADPQTSSGTSTPDRIRFKAFPYSGINDFMIFCQPDFLSMGGGDGRYGLWLDDALENGQSQPSETFGNEGLSEEGNDGVVGNGDGGGGGGGRGRFEVLGVEIWYIGA